MNTSDVSWIKLKLTMFDDEKIRVIESMDGGDAKLIVWVKLLTLAGKCNRNGYLMISEKIPYTPDMIAVVINRKPAEVKMALDAFIELGMIENDNNVFIISNWSKHQNETSLESIREKTKARVRAHREKNKGILSHAIQSNDNQFPKKLVDVKEEECNVTCNASSNVTVTLPSQEKGEVENKDINVTNVTLRSKKNKSATSLHSAIKNKFKERYFEIFDAEYYWTAKDASACEQLIKKVSSVIRSRSPAFTDQQVVDASSYIFRNITDPWLLQNFSMTIINSKFNEIVSQIKSPKIQKANSSKVDAFATLIQEEWNRQS